MFEVNRYHHISSVILANSPVIFQSEVDEALSGVLSRACSLEGRLRTASQAYTKLGEVKSDAQTAADMVDKTAALAKDVSAKVRQLDLARVSINLYYLSKL